MRHLSLSRFDDSRARFVDSSVRVSPTADSRGGMHTSRHSSKVVRPRLAGMGLAVTIAVTQLAGGSSVQATTAVSNLGNFHNGNFGIIEEDLITRGRAQSFTTGSDPLLLESATLAMSSIGASEDGGFQVSLYGNSGSNFPDTKLLTLTGSDTPIDSANYTFTAPVEFTLAPSTTYWIVAELPLNGPSNANYFWTFTANLAEEALPGWSMGTSADSVSFMGSTPTWGPQSVPLRMSIDVQSVPEPTSASLVGISMMMMFATIRRRSTQTK